MKRYSVWLQLKDGSENGKWVGNGYEAWKTSSLAEVQRDVALRRSWWPKYTYEVREYHQL
jgi:hypothetical protein